MPFNDVFKLRLVGRLHGSQMINVMHFVQDDPLPTIGGQQLANDFATNMRATLIARCSNQMLFEYVEVQSLIPFSGGPVTANFPGGTVGSLASACQTAMICEVITIYSSRGGRRGRGRIYLAGAPTSGTELGSGVWNPTQTTRTTAFATAMAARYMDPLGTLQFRLGVFSRVLGGQAPPFSTNGFVRATALTVRTIARTQRRRQVGVGR
jgi:hypothetical protein